ncbi:MAG: DUF4340 domain-containing protein [Polyangiaceae bacterium]|nr:DUF4340 domain-containing protein [Polyangiaceae bacterium]
MTNPTNSKPTKIYLHFGVAVALMLAIVPGCKTKDEVGSVATSSELPELRVVPAEIDKITVTNGSHLETKFEKRDGSWTITSPPPAGAANVEAVQAMLQNLSESKIKELISASASPEDLKLYELTPDKAMHIVVERGGNTVADLSFGKSGPRGQMVQVGSKKGIWVASGYSSYLYGRELIQWRAAASANQNSAMGKPAGEVLKEHPELVDFVPDDVLRRAAAYASGDLGEVTCPALEKITSSDEFERREAVAKATAACKPENDRVLEFLKTCPVFARVHVNVSAYNFEKHMYSLSAKNNMAAQITQPGHALIRNKALVLWPGVQRMFERGSGGVAMDTLCKTRGPINDTVAAVTGIGIDLPMSEAEAKTFRDKMKIAKEDDPNAGTNEGVIEVALQLDGKATREELA